MIPPSRKSSKSKSTEDRDALDIGTVLLSMGADRIPSGSGWQKMKCPVHGERIASATVNISEGAFMCFSCGAKGDAISIIRLVDDCTFTEACAKYKEITGQEMPGLRTTSHRGTASATEAKSYESSGGYLANRLRKH